MQALRIVESSAGGGGSHPFAPPERPRVPGTKSFRTEFPRAVVACRIVACGIIATAVGLGASAPGAATAADRPNIVWIVVDDMSADFGCYRPTPVPTPHVDRLAAEGTRFTHAFVTAPVCSPCRSALITGMYQTTIGGHHHRSGRGRLTIELPAGVRPLPAILREAGYHTCIGDGIRDDIGEGAGRPTKRQGLGKTDYNFSWDPAIYDGEDWAGRRAGQPFFMQVMLAGGKLRDGPQGAERARAAATREFGVACAPAAVSLPPYLPRDPALLDDRAAYFDAVRLTDAHVGRVLHRLEREGILDGTLVVFLTDHGWSHARAKQFLYDEGTHVPLVVRGPGIPRAAVRDDLVEHIDVAALTLAAAGVAPPPGLQARDPFAPGHRPREAVFAARDRCDETVDRIRSIRTPRYLYIRNGFPRRPMLQPNAYKDAKPTLRRLRELEAAGGLDPLARRILFAPERPPEELYAWQDDPWQLTNLAGDPAHAAPLAEARELLDRKLAETNDPPPEDPARYDSDMAVYVGAGNPELERTIALMKEWAAAGR